MGTLYTANLIVTLLLVGACVLLFIDGRGKARAIEALQTALAAAHRRLGSQDEQIGYLARAVALLVPADARPTTEYRPIAGLSRPFAPSPEQVAQARMGHAEVTGGAAFSESPEAMRARIEAEADERSRARVALPPPAAVGPDGDEPEEEPTTFYSGRGVRRATLLGGLAGAPLERPQMSASRTAETFRKAHPSSPTLVSEGIRPPAAKRDTLTPTDPGTPALDARILRRLAEKVASAQGDGEDAAHCHGARCFREGQDITTCECHCEGCSLVERLLVEARQDVLGEEW